MMEFIRSTDNDLIPFRWTNPLSSLTCTVAGRTTTVPSSLTTKSDAVARADAEKISDLLRDGAPVDPCS